MNYDASVKIESNGKSKWLRVGTWIPSDKSPVGFCLKLDTVPVDKGWNGFIYAFAPRDREEAARPAARPLGPPMQAEDPDDDIPF